MRLLLVLLGLLAAARAHPLIQNSMWVVFAPDRVRVAVNVSLREILVAQQVNADDAVALDAATKKHGDYLVRHLTLSAQARTLDGRIQNITPPVIFGGDPEQTFYQYELDYPLLTGGPTESVTFAHTMLGEWSYAPGQAWDVTYVVRLKRSDQPEVTTGLLRAGAPQDFPTGWTVPSPAAREKRSAWIPATIFTLVVLAGVIAIWVRSCRSSPVAR